MTGEQLKRILYTAGIPQTELAKKWALRNSSKDSAKSST